jgi:hypothetical protein
MASEGFLLKELFDWVAVQTGLVPTTEWHCGQMPPETEGACAVLLDAGGDPMQPRLRHNLCIAQFQVLALGPTGSDYWDAYRLAYQIHNVMGDVRHTILGDGTYTPTWEADVISADSRPAYIGGDERFRFEISCMYSVSARTAQLMAV